MPWTKFWDMHSGGSTKEPPFNKIYIEASEAEAKSIFYSRFGHNPERVTCTCCGEDYSIDEHATLGEATAYDRDLTYIKPDWAAGDLWFGLPLERKHEANALSTYLEIGEEMPEGFVVGDAWRSTRTPVSVDEYFAREGVLVIVADDIADHERTAVVPEQGYVWQD